MKSGGLNPPNGFKNTRAQWAEEAEQFIRRTTSGHDDPEGMVGTWIQNMSRVGLVVGDNPSQRSERWFQIPGKNSPRENLSISPV